MHLNWESCLVYCYTQSWNLRWYHEDKSHERGGGMWPAIFTCVITLWQRLKLQAAGDMSSDVSIIISSHIIYIIYTDTEWEINIIVTAIGLPCTSVSLMFKWSTYCQAQVQSQIKLLNPSSKSKSKIQSPKEREWDWGWHYNPTGHPPPTINHPPLTFLTWNVNLVMGKDHPWPSLTFLDLPWPSLTFHGLHWPSMTFYDLLSHSNTFYD